MENSIINAESASYLGTLDVETVDLTVFSPPYDLIREYNGFKLDLGDLGDHLFRISKDGAVTAVIIADGTRDFAKSLTSFRLAVDWVDRIGFKLFETVIYRRHGRPGPWFNQRFRTDYEFVHLFFKGKRPKFFDKSHLAIPCKYAGTKWHGTQRLTDGSLEQVSERVLAATKCRGNVWEYAASNTESNPLKLKHPATMPDALAFDLIKCFSQPGELVLDPCCGSGTTCVVASRLGRRYLGVEISTEYVALAQARLLAEVKEDIF